jgi:hypothetical protein
MTESAPTPKQWQLANCHCGTIQYRVLIPPLTGVSDPHKVTNCNCHLCTRNGYLVVFPTREEIRVRLPLPPSSSPSSRSPSGRAQTDNEREFEEVSPGSEQLRSIPGILGYYVIDDSPRKLEHVFCLRCGSSLWVDKDGGEKAFRAKIEDAKAKGDEEAAKEKDVVVINVSRSLFLSAGSFGGNEMIQQIMKKN